MAVQNRKKVNITEVAAIAGVSAMTVSRLLNHRGKVAPATRIKVQKVIDELNYTPNPIAQGLVTSRTKIIGLMIYDDMDSLFFHQMLIGIQYAVRMNGYNLLIFSKDKDKGVPENRYFGMVDGILCMGNHIDNKTLEYIEYYGIPYAVIGRRNWRNADPWFCAVDYVNGFKKVTKYLIDMGHRNIAFWGGTKDYEPDEDKITGYRQALTEAGLTFTSEMILYRNEAEKIRKVYEQYHPTAIIVEGPAILLSLLLFIKETGLAIPRDISVVGTINDLGVHSLYNLAKIHELTLAEVPRRELGISGAELLFRLIQKEENIPKVQWVDIKFTEGESCVAPGERSIK